MAIASSSSPRRGRRPRAARGWALRAEPACASGPTAPASPPRWTIQPACSPRAARAADCARRLPRVLDDTPVVVAARGAAAGCARLLGAALVVPPGATGDVDSDLHAQTPPPIDAL